MAPVRHTKVGHADTSDFPTLTSAFYTICHLDLVCGNHLEPRNWKLLSRLLAVVITSGTQTCLYRSDGQHLSNNVFTNHTGLVYPSIRIIRRLHWGLWTLHQYQQSPRSTFDQLLFQLQVAVSMTFARCRGNISRQALHGFPIAILPHLEYWLASTLTLGVPSARSLSPYAVRCENVVGFPFHKTILICVYGSKNIQKYLPPQKAALYYPSSIVATYL